MNINNLADIKKRYLQLRPVNASSGGVYSFRNGLPIVKFDISASMNPLLMDGSDLRISGRLTCRKNDGTAIIGGHGCGRTNASITIATTAARDKGECRQQDRKYQGN